MIVIPMAGLSSRFTAAGYDRPKYMLPLLNRPVFDFSVATFRDVFSSEDFLFVATRYPGIEAFIADRLSALGVVKYRLVLLDAPTRGQAETVMMGLDRAKTSEDEAITIFNIDTFCLGSFAPPKRRFPDAAGTLQVFRGEGSNWSFIEPDSQNEGCVVRTTEKLPISDYCCTGMYSFARVDSYRRAFEKELVARQATELYIAPMYNHLITDGERVRYDLISRNEVVFCGVPTEYEALRADPSALTGCSFP